MAASVRLEDFTFSDPRVKRLGRLIGSDVFGALGRLAFVWRYCCEMQVYAVGATTLADLTDCDDFGAHLVAAGLAEEVGDLLRVKGLEGRIEWLTEKREAAKRGGAATKAKWEANRRPSGLAVACQQAGHVPGPAFAFASVVEEKNKGMAPTPAERRPRKQHPDFRRFTDAFGELFAEANGGAKPTWETDAKRQAADRILKACGLEEGVRRAQGAFRSPPSWPPPPYDILAFAQHFDKFIQPARAGPVGPVRVDGSEVYAGGEVKI